MQRLRCPICTTTRKNISVTEVFIMLRIEYFDKNRFMKQVAASRGSIILHLAVARAISRCIL